MTDTTNHAEVIRKALVWFRDEVDYATNSEEARAVAPIPKAIAALDALTREAEHLKETQRGHGWWCSAPPTPLTDDEFNIIAAQSERIAKLEEALAKAEEYIGTLESCADGYYRADESDEAVAWRVTRAALAPKEQQK